MALGAARAGVIGEGGVTGITLYVIMGLTNQEDVHVRDAADGSLIYVALRNGQSIPNQGAYSQLAIVGDGTLWITNDGPASGQYGLRRLDPLTNTVVGNAGPVTTGDASAPSAYPNGDVVSSSGSGSGGSGAKRFPSAGGATPLWAGFGESQMFGTALMPDGDVIYAANTGYLARVIGSTGASVWRLTTLGNSGFFPSSVATERTGVYVYVHIRYTGGSRIQKRLASDGSLVWETVGGTGGGIPLAVDKNSDLLHTRDGLVCKVSHVDGSEIWNWTPVAGSTPAGLTTDQRGWTYVHLSSSTAADNGIQALLPDGTPDWWLSYNTTGRVPVANATMEATPGRTRVSGFTVAV